MIKNRAYAIGTQFIFHNFFVYCPSDKMPFGPINSLKYYVRVSKKVRQASLLLVELV